MLVMVLLVAGVSVQQVSGGTGAPPGGVNVSLSRQLQSIGAQVSNNPVPGLISEYCMLVLWACKISFRCYYM